MTRQPNISQGSLFDNTPGKVVQLNAELSRRKRDEGIERAVRSANKKEPRWIDHAFELFEKWLEDKPSGYSFMIEDFRDEISKQLTQPPSNRAFGGLAVRGRKRGLIKSVGRDTVSNVDAHQCYANRWQKI